MVHSKTAVIVLGLALIAGCEEKKTEASKAADSIGATAQKAADATKDTAQKAADATKDTAQKAADATKDAAQKASDTTKDLAKTADAAKDTSISEVQKLIEPAKKQFDELVAKAAARPELKPAVDAIKGDFTGIEKLLTEAKTSDKWSTLLADAKTKFASVQKQITELSAKLVK